MKLWIDDKVVAHGRWVSLIACRCGKKTPIDISAYRERFMLTNIPLPRCHCGHFLLSYNHEM